MPSGALPARLRSTTVLYALALLAEVLLFYRRVLFYPGFLFPWDFRAVHLPLATFVADSFARGEFPLWDPYTYCGYPVYANIQTALFYPPVLAATVASNWLGSDSLPRLLAVAVAVMVFFSGLCTFALVRRLGARPSAAWIAATMYQLGCFFASQAQHTGAVHGATWLPLAWWCVIELRARLRWFWVAVLSAALSMMILAGLPQVAVAGFGSVLLLAAILAIYRLANRLLPLHVLIAWAWALALAAVQIVPTIELTRNSVAKYRAEWLRSGGGIKAEALYSLLIPNYWNVFDLSRFHEASDPTFLYLYSSLLGLALAIAAICWKPDRWRQAFSALTIAATVWMLGDSTPIGRTVFLALPVSVRIGIHPEFAMCAFALGIAVLAGLGAGAVLKSTGLQVLAGVIIAVDLLAVSSGRPFNTSFLSAEPGITRDSGDGSRELVARLRALTGAATPPYRFDMTDVSFVWSSTAPILQIPTANGCDPLAPERIIQVRLSFAPGARWGTCYQVVNPSSPMLGLMNVRYLLSRSALSSPDLRLATEAGGYKIYENTRVLPRFFLVNRTERASDLMGAAAFLHAPDFNPAEVAIVEGPALPEYARNASGRVEVLSYRSSSISLLVESSSASFLVAADAYYPGWQATIDGRRAELYIADVAFRGVEIPAGTHRVEMRFVPRILFGSSVLSVLAWLSVFAVARKPARRGKA